MHGDLQPIAVYIDLNGTYLSECRETACNLFLMFRQLCICLSFLSEILLDCERKLSQ